MKYLLFAPNPDLDITSRFQFASLRFSSWKPRTLDRPRGVNVPRSRPARRGALIRGRAGSLVNPHATARLSARQPPLIGGGVAPARTPFILPVAVSQRTISL